MPNSTEKEPQAPQDNQGMRLPDLIRLLREEKFSFGEDGAKVLYLNSKPALGGVMFLGPEGYPEYSFGQKFEEGFKGWEKGDRITTHFKAVRRKNNDGTKQLELQVSENVVGDIRHADSFILEGLSSEDETALNSLGMVDIEAVIQVIGKIKRNYQLSDQQEYLARIDRIIAIQRPWDGDPKKLEPERSVLVEGTVVNYKPDMEYPHTGAEIDIKLANNKPIWIKLWNGYLTIEDGTIEIFDPSHPVPGDKIQVNTTYGNPGKRYGRDEEDCLYAYFCRSTYLLEPHPKRVRAYHGQRKDFIDRMTQISKLTTPSKIRYELALVLRKNMSQEGKINLTSAEKKKIERFIRDKFTNDNEKPLKPFEDTWGMADFEKGYGVDAYAMSRDELYEFCLHVAMGTKKMFNPDGASDSPWRVMYDNLTDQQKKKILLTAVRTFTPIVVGKFPIRRADIVVDPKNIPDIHFKSYGHRIGNMVVTGKGEYNPAQLANGNNVTQEDTYLFHQTLSYLTHHVDIEVARAYLELAETMLKRDLFMKVSDDTRVEYSEYEILSHMNDNILENILWKDNKWGTKIVGLKDSTTAREYLKQMAMLGALSEKMSRLGWTNRGARSPSEYVDKAIRSLKIIDDYLKSIHLLLN